MNSAAANRARVAQSRGDTGKISPGLDAGEVGYLKALGFQRIGEQRNRGHTQFAGGWRSAKFQAHIGNRTEQLPDG